MGLRLHLRRCACTPGPRSGCFYRVKTALAVPPPSAPTDLQPPRPVLPPAADKHLELIARVMGWANAALDAYRRAKAFVLSQGGLALAILVLVVALLLRWLGWL